MYSKQNTKIAKGQLTTTLLLFHLSDIWIGLYPHQINANCKPVILELIAQLFRKCFVCE